jgi:hypothetical protein
MSRKNSRRTNMSMSSMMGGKYNSRRNRKNSRKNYRKNSRKNYRKNSRRNYRRENLGAMMGGEYNAGELNLEQGQEYLKAHENQYGGAAPVGEYTLALPGDLAPSSRLTQLDDAFSQIKGMSDFGETMTGGRRRKSRKSKKSRKESRKSKKASRKSKKASRKSKKASRKSKKASRKSKKAYRKNRKSSRRMRGGAMAGAPYNSPNMLLSPMMAAKAGTADFSNPLLKY